MCFCSVYWNSLREYFTSEELQILLKNGATKKNIINTNSNRDMFTNTYGYIINYKKQFCTTLRIIVDMSEASRQQQW